MGEAHDEVAEVKAHINAKLRCWRCNRMLAVKVTRPWRIRCGQCKTENASRA